MKRTDVLIVGGGHAGAQAAVALRNGKFAGSITILSDEPELPYQRPPLSKAYLAGAEPFEKLLLRQPQFWSERSIDMALGELATSVDPIAKEVRTATGATFGYGSLVWASGGQARRLTCAGVEYAGVHSVRCRADVDRMIAELPNVARAVVIGGGYIGLEAASVLTKLGKRVTMLEALPRVLSRVAGETIAHFYEAEHRAHGVDLRTNATVACIEGEHGKVRGVRLADGEVLPADMVIVGVGIVPAVEPLLQAGAECNNGVIVDEHCRTTLPDVYAIGDCAAHVNAFAGGARIRLESVQNANEQAGAVARTLCGQPTPYHSLPWFWSDQYDLKLQTVGLSMGHDAAVVRGAPASRTFSVVYLREGCVVALDCVNAARDYVQGRKLVLDKARPDVAALADPAVALKEIS